MNLLKRIFAFGIAATLGASPSLARADDAVVVRPVKTKRVSYAWQTLLVDGAAVGLTLGGLSLRDATAQNTVVSSGVGAFVLGAPFVHLAHERGGAFAGSLLLRTLAPALAIGTFALIFSGDGKRGEWDFRGLAAVAAGTAVGTISAIVIDAAVFAHEDVPVVDHDAVRVLPSFAVVPGGARLGVGGVF